MLRILLGVGLVAALGVSLWAILRPGPDRTGPDRAKEEKQIPVEAIQANSRGIGYSLYFDKPYNGKDAYELAREAFEEAIRLAPDWTVAKVNLGIALLNDYTRPEKRETALKVFAEVLEKDPDNPHAHFCSGLILYHKSQPAEAASHFEVVTRVDPRDAHAWYFRAMSQPEWADSDDAYTFLKNALKLNAYLNPARYSLSQHRITAEDPKRKQQLLDEFDTWDKSGATDFAAVKATEMGYYGDLIGKPATPLPDVGVFPMFDPVKEPVAKLAAGTAWAGDDKVDELRKAVRSRFGGGMVLIDYDRDGKPDVLLLGAVIRGGQVCDVLLRNEGNNAFTDVTAEVGLAAHAGSFGGAVGDYDNDGFQDLVLAGPAGLKLFRNVEGKRFEDKSAAAGFDKEAGVFLTAAWVDLDQDGDTDLVAAKYAATPESALKLLRGEKVEGGGGLVAFVNIGVAPVIEPGKPILPLSTAFKPAEHPALKLTGPVCGVVVTDVDGDLDLDLIVLRDGQPPATITNDRMMRFSRGEAVLSAAGKWSGGLVLDANGDDQPDLVLAESGELPRVLVSQRDRPGESLATRFAATTLDAQGLRSAAWIDLDLDGRADLVGLAAGKPVALQGDGRGKFTRKLSPFGPRAEMIPDLLAVAAADLDGDNSPDVLLWSASGGLHVFRNLGNGNRGIRLALTGIREILPAGETGKPMRTNADGVGTWVRVHAGPLAPLAENTSLGAGLGHSRLPLHFGIGKADAAEVIRVRWPDQVIQGEVNQAAGAITIREFNRKPVSCPILFTWDGERFAYVTDFLGAGSVGEESADGSTRPPRPEESVKIEAGQLAPKNGKYVVKVAEPMDEVMYLDRLRLDVIDHPADVSVFPDERFATSDPQPTQERLYFRDTERVFAARATDHRGRDVTATLRERDGRHVEGFAIRSWLGYAEDHHVELEFNGTLKDLPAGRKVYLVLAGWVDYPYPESIYAATQAGVPTIAPVLEQKQRDGSWKLLGEVGFPAGLTRVMTRDITGWIDPDGGPVRLRTNLQVYWDQLFIAPAMTAAETSVRELAVSRASLEHRGFVQEYSPGGKPPIAYDYDRMEPVAVTRWQGKFTRTGDVTELLSATDDRHVICGPGDEVTAEFNATGLPPLPLGWKRSFVLRSWGYCKDSAPTTLTAGRVGPLPYRSMPRYPYDPEKTPPPAAVAEYDRMWNTRAAGAR